MQKDIHYGANMNSLGTIKRIFYRYLSMGTFFLLFFMNCGPLLLIHMWVQAAPYDYVYLCLWLCLGVYCKHSYGTETRKVLMSVWNCGKIEQNDHRLWVKFPIKMRWFVYSTLTEIHDEISPTPPLMYSSSLIKINVKWANVIYKSCIANYTSKRTIVRLYDNNFFLFFPLLCFIYWTFYSTCQWLWMRLHNSDLKQAYSTWVTAGEFPHINWELNWNFSSSLVYFESG